METGVGLVALRSVNRCEPSGIPVIGKSFVFRCEMVHDGLMRRSEEEDSELTRTVTSAAVWRRDMMSGAAGFGKMTCRRRGRGLAGSCGAIWGYVGVFEVVY